MTREETRILKEYSKSVNIDINLVKKVFEHGDSTQRKIDIIGIEATILIKKWVKDGLIQLNKKGQVKKPWLKKYDQLIQEFLASKKDKPEFFINPLPIKTITKTKDDTTKAATGERERPEKKG